MGLTDRQERILAILQDRERLSVRELTDILYVSDMTVRRDLAVLQRQGFLQRYHGGALRNSGGERMPIALRQYLNETDKKRLCRKAAAYLENDFLVYLDSSSTCLHIVSALAGYQNIRVVTNSVSVLTALTETTIPCIATGGELYKPDLCFVGEDAISYVGGICPDVAFFSTGGYEPDTGRISDNDPRQNALRRAVMKNARKSVFLYDRSKCGVRCRYTLCTESDGDVILI